MFFLIQSKEPANTVIQTIQLGIPVARIELLDDVQMDSVNKYSNLNYPVKDTLFMEFHGTENGVKEQSQLVQELLKKMVVKIFNGLLT